MHAVVVEQRDRAGGARAKQRLGAAADFGQQFGQRRVARDQPQHALLGREHFGREAEAVARALRFGIQGENLTCGFWSRLGRLIRYIVTARGFPHPGLRRWVAKPDGGSAGVVPQYRYA